MPQNPQERQLRGFLPKNLINPTHQNLVPLILR